MCSAGSHFGSHWDINRSSPSVSPFLLSLCILLSRNAEVYRKRERLRDERKIGAKEQAAAAPKVNPLRRRGSVATTRGAVKPPLFESRALTPTFLPQRRAAGDSYPKISRDTDSLARASETSRGDFALAHISRISTPWKTREGRRNGGNALEISPRGQSCRLLA